MQEKPFYLSKTFWSLLITFFIVVWNETVTLYLGLPKIPEWIISLLAALGLYYRWTAKGPLILYSKKSNNNSDNLEKENEEKNLIEERIPLIDENLLNTLDNRSYFIINRLGTSEDFKKLPEEDKSLNPEIFRQKYPTNKFTESSKEDKEEVVTEEEVINHLRQKYELMNKITFLMERCGTKQDFYQLPADIRTLENGRFKEKLKDLCPEKS